MPGHGLRVDGEHHGRGIALPVVLGHGVDGGRLGVQLEVLLGRRDQLVVVCVVAMVVGLDVSVDVDRVDGIEIDSVLVLFAGHQCSLRLDRQDLVDAHPALLEGQRAADEIQPPHPGHLFALQCDESVEFALECRQPVLGGAHVVLRIASTWRTSKPPSCTNFSVRHNGRICMSGAMYDSMNGPPPGAVFSCARHLLQQQSTTRLQNADA